MNDKLEDLFDIAVGVFSFCLQLLGAFYLIILFVSWAVENKVDERIENWLK